ncbi:MAG: hypothetical protein HQ557_02120 [Bacteroidetes bacterium]|nr:hypothetical protein [Bacteroidota bacterium]
MNYFNIYSFRAVIIAKGKQLLKIRHFFVVKEYSGSLHKSIYLVISTSCATVIKNRHTLDMNKVENNGTQM